MADFPSKVTTETGSPTAQSSAQGGNSLRAMASNVAYMVDMSFFRSIPAILMMAEIFLGLLLWSLIASSHYKISPAFSWVLFVAITAWLLTIILFCLILFSLQHRITFVPWPMTTMAYHAVVTLLYLTAFVANAASVPSFTQAYHYGHFAAAAFFAAVVTVLYGVSAYFSYLDWRGGGSDAATNTVPT